jgi:hypothetical protein
MADQLDLDKVRAEIASARMCADTADYPAAYGAVDACARLLADEVRRLRDMPTYRQAIADLRDTADKRQAASADPTMWAVYSSSADFLESRLTEGSTT